MGDGIKGRGEEMSEGGREGGRGGVRKKEREETVP